MNSAAPRVSVTMLQHGKAVKAAAPGNKIELAVKVRHTTRDICITDGPRILRGLYPPMRLPSQ